MSYSVTKEVDHYYMDVSISGAPNTSLTEAKFDATFDKEFIENASEFYMSIIKFSIPLSQIPLMYFPLDRTQNSPVVSKMIVAIDNGGIFPAYVIYEPSQTGVVSAPLPYPNPIDGFYFSYTQAASEYYAIRSIVDFLDMVNNTINTALVNASLPIGSVYLNWDPVSQLFNITMSQSFINSGATIIFNGFLRYFFPSFRYKESYITLFGVNQLCYTFNFNTLYATSLAGPDVYSQESSSVFNMFNLRRIVCVSNSLPVSPEYRTQINFDSSANVSTSSEIVDFKKVVTDFDIAYSNSSQLDGVLSYVPSGEYRLIDLIGNNKLDTLDLQFYIMDQYTRFHKLYIDSYQSVFVKIMFRRKTFNKK